MTEVAFRVDASIGIGTGHVVRCLTLADALAQKGANCCFIVRSHAGHMVDTIRARGYDVHVLVAPSVSPVRPASAYDHWLGVSVEQDVTDTLNALQNTIPDWLIVDHYAISYDWQTKVRPHVKAIGVVDDLANRAHDADLLIDQNYSTEVGHRYDGLLPKHAVRLCGPRYALLKPAYLNYRSRQTEPRAGTCRLLIFFGGTDDADLTGRALRDISGTILDRLKIDVVIGANNPHAASIKSIAGGNVNVSVHGPRPHLADLMALADIGIGAGGGTTWERCCLGLPSIVVSIAENQRPACQALANDGLIEYVGHWDRIEKRMLYRAISAMLDDPTRMQRMRVDCRAIVDGEGAERVAHRLLIDAQERRRMCL